MRPQRRLNSVLVTAGGSGIGVTLAIELALRGCRVIVSGGCRSALDEVAAPSERISACAGDVTSSGLVDTDMVRGFMQRSPEEFPAKAADEDLLSNGRIASAQMMGCFASWLLLDVGADRFATTDRDVSDTDHHDEWTNGVRYPNLRS